MILFKYLKEAIELLDYLLRDKGTSINSTLESHPSYETIDNVVNKVWYKHFKEDFRHLYYGGSEEQVKEEKLESLVLLDELRETLRFKYVKNYSSDKFDDADLLFNLMVI